ncbi:MAG: alpha/beta fold hydrolase [Pseudomonadota bacterium]
MLNIALLLIGGIVAALLVLELVFPHAAARFFLGLERRRSGLTRREATLDGIRTVWMEGGRGDTLVLLHGFGADKDNYVRVARYLTPHFHVVIPDLPGFGESERLLDAPYSFEDQTHRLRGILREMGIDRCHIGGSSMGGAIAALYGAHYPRHTLSRWLLAPAGVDGSEDSEMVAHYRATQVSLLLPTSVPDFRRVMELAVEIKPLLTPSIRKVLGERAIQDVTLHTRVFEEIALSEPINDTVRTSDVPTLVVWGELDRVLHPSGGPILDSVLPQSRLIMMPGVGHLPMVEDIAGSARAYIAFVQGLSNQTGM